MPRIICPNCGALTDTGAPDYPFCARCQDNLAKCGYCRWFDARMGTCTHPVVAGIFEVSHDATPPCVYHSPKDSILQRRALLGVLTWVLVVLVITILGYGVARLLSRPDSLPAPELELSVEVDYTGAVVGEPHTVIAGIYNPSTMAVSGVRFEIASQSFEHFALKSTTPRPAKIEERGVWTTLSYGSVGPRARQRISLELVPKTAGSQHLLVRLVSGENVFHGMADVPIIVGETSERIGESPEGEGEDSGDETR